MQHENSQLLRIVSLTTNLITKYYISIKIQTKLYLTNQKKYTKKLEKNPAIAKL